MFNTWIVESQKKKPFTFKVHFSVNPSFYSAWAFCMKSISSNGYWIWQFCSRNRKDYREKNIFSSSRIKSAHLAQFSENMKKCCTGLKSGKVWINFILEVGRTDVKKLILLVDPPQIIIFTPVVSQSIRPHLSQSSQNHCWPRLAEWITNISFILILYFI